MRENIKAVIGPREIAKSVEAGIVKSVLVANNCPKKLVEKAKSLGIEIKQFNGDQKELGTYLGKPFLVAMAGIQEKV